MSYPRLPVQRYDAISTTTANIAKKALESLSRIPVQQKPEDGGGDVKSGRVSMEKAAKLYPSMHSIGFDLYRIATEDERVPTIWKKETVVDEKTGAKVDWLVAYTTDEDDLVRDLTASMKGTSWEKPWEKKKKKKEGEEGEEDEKKDDDENTDKKSSIKAVAVPPEGPKKNQTPIAPGIMSKNLTLDQSGTGGTAKVTVEFNDVNKGQEFFEGVEETAGGTGGKPGAPPASKTKEEELEAATPEEGAAVNSPEAQAPKGPPAPQAPPAPMASTIRNMTFYGQQMAIVRAEKFAHYPTKYYYVNEAGERVDLGFEPKVGTRIRRPDQPETLIRVQAVVSEHAKSDDEDIIAKLAVDISDQVPPMNWTNRESQNEEGEAGKGGPQPPNPALQQGQPPTADTTNQQPAPVYDSEAGKGLKPHYNLTVNPEDNSVKVKMEEPDMVQAIDQAVQGPQPVLAPGVAPQQPQQQGAGMTGQPKADFNNQESPVQF